MQKAIIVGVAMPGAGNENRTGLDELNKALSSGFVVKQVYQFTTVAGAQGAFVGAACLVLLTNGKA